MFSLLLGSLLLLASLVLLVFLLLLSSLQLLAYLSLLTFWLLMASFLLLASLPILASLCYFSLYLCVLYCEVSTQIMAALCVRIKTSLSLSQKQIYWRKSKGVANPFRGLRVQRGSNSSASACCTAGPGSIPGSAALLCGDPSSE